MQLVNLLTFGFLSLLALAFAYYDAEGTKTFVQHEPRKMLPKTEPHFGAHSVLFCHENL